MGSPIFARGVPVRIDTVGAGAGDLCVGSVGATYLHPQHQVTHVRATMDEVDAYCTMRALGGEKILVIRDNEVKLMEFATPHDQVNDRLRARFGDDANLVVTRVDVLGLTIFELSSNGMVIG